MVLVFLVTTQQIMMVGQLMRITVLCLPSLVLVASAATLQCKVEPLLHILSHCCLMEVLTLLTMDMIQMKIDSHGGAINLVFGSTFSITHDTTVYWENNYAHFGGAISVRNINFIYCTQIAKFIPLQKCFFQLQGQNLSNTSDPNFVLNNNSADAAGTILFGGTIDNCTVSSLDSHNSSEVFNKLFQYEADNTTSSVSSDPFHVCLCDQTVASRTRHY